MSTVQIVGQISFCLMLAAFSMRNITPLRVAAIAASLCTIYFYAAGEAEPQWVPILWNLGFIAVHCAHLLYALSRQRAVALSPIENFLQKSVLANFPPAEVKSFAQIAAEGELPAGKQLIRQGTELAHLFCLVQGKVEIHIKGKKHAELGPGYFVGEMCLLTKSLTRADVVASSDLKLLVWPHADIEKWVSSDATRLGLLQTALGSQVVDQLLRQNDALLADMQERMIG